MTVGTELRQARERAGLTAEQISDRTKIQLHKVAALESDDYERLPQGIYLDGIVRAYARELGLPDGPLVERLRLVQDRSNAAPPDGIIDAVEGNAALDWFATERAPAPAPPAPAPPAPVPPVATARQEATEPLHTRRRSLTIAALAAVAAVGMAMVVYQRQPPPEDRPRVAAESVTRPPTPDSGASGSTDRTARPPGSPADTAPPAAAEPPRAEVSTPAAPSAPESNAAALSVDDLTGAWTIATTVESSSLARYKGLQLGYEMQLSQHGDRVSGAGRKVTENGAGISRRAQTPVTVDGRIHGDRLLLNFVEKGTRRSTRGRFELAIEESGALRGSFSSTAARSSGRVEAQRISAH